MLHFYTLSYGQAMHDLLRGILVQGIGISYDSPIAFKASHFTTMIEQFCSRHKITVQSMTCNRDSLAFSEIEVCGIYSCNFGRPPSSYRFCFWQEPFPILNYLKREEQTTFPIKSNQIIRFRIVAGQAGGCFSIHPDTSRSLIGIWKSSTSSL